MKQFIYDWIQNLSIYMVLMMAVLQLIANKDYQKYFQFLSGLLFILLLITPLMKITNTQTTFQELFQSIQYQQETELLEEYETYLMDSANLWEEEP